MLNVCSEIGWEFFSQYSFLTFFVSIILLQTLIPVDFQSAGQIIDDELYERLVTKMPAGVTVVVLMDCCHSGTALDLPYQINATQSKMSLSEGFNFGLLDSAGAVIGCCICIMYLFEMVGGALSG